MLDTSDNMSVNQIFKLEDKTRQDKARQGKARQDKTRQDKIYFVSHHRGLKLFTYECEVFQEKVLMSLTNPLMIDAIILKYKRLQVLW